MKVILLRDVPGTGKKNQVLNVSDGFARNYLFPRKWAVQATDKAVQEVEHQKEVERRKEAERRQNAQNIAQALEGKTITIEAKAGEGGRLYGSVTAQEVADALKKQFGTEVDKRKIELKDSIRQVGKTNIEVKLYLGISAKMNVDVVAVQ
ncbi:MAG: 50S ribosomal protein L9 [Eubacteriales bacterium]|nr:50S ribosomal protein L9 [Eubacteriales bacterium]